MCVSKNILYQNRSYQYSTMPNNQNENNTEGSSLPHNINKPGQYHQQNQSQTETTTTNKILSNSSQISLSSHSRIVPLFGPEQYFLIFDVSMPILSRSFINFFITKPVAPFATVITSNENSGYNFFQFNAKWEVVILFFSFNRTRSSLLCGSAGLVFIFMSHQSSILSSLHTIHNFSRQKV